MTGCKPSVEQPSLYVEPACLAEQNICRVTTPIAEFEVRFNVKKVRAEIPFEIVIVSQESIEDLQFNAHLEGKDMFMGKVPVFFQSLEDDNNVVKASTLLASCSEDVMTWQLVLTVSSDQQSEQSATVFVEFDSSRY
ncbi:hypothetical protein [Thalassotalea sp. PLHSN55]|uniref:hypothetical protein n=1 Tax=Thalassotalea sp. PLHSN55 TaxID=3435888 RepID=UPI003F824235